MYPYCKESAFTLLELMICLAILMITISLVTPSIHSFKQKQEQKLILSTIKQHVSLAKYSAVSLRRNVVICSSKNYEICEDQQWNNAFILFVDLNKNKQREANEPLLQVTKTHNKYGNLIWKGGVTNLQTVTFQGDTGLPRGSQGAFYYCSYQALNHTYVAISGMGHTRVEQRKSCA